MSPRVGSWLHAELVAFRVGHGRDLRVAPQDGGPKPYKPADLIIHSRRGTQIEMDTVLRALRLRDPGEPDVRSAPAGRLYERFLSRRVLIDVGPESRRPERREREGVV